MIEITAKATGNKTGEILVYGAIRDTKYWDEDVTPKDFDKKLKELGDISDLTVRINSYGGSVFAGNAIVSMLDTKKANGWKVTTVVEGIAASMASVIAQAGDDVRMAENAMVMIHKPSSLAWGNADEMRKTAEMLDKAEKTLIPIYMRHYKGSEDELKELLRKEEWLNSDEALEKGLCTSVSKSVQVSACAGKYIFNDLMVPAAVLTGAISKIKVTNNEGGENEMFTDEQITQIKGLVDTGKQACISKSKDGFLVIGEAVQAQLDSTKEYLTAEQVKSAVGTELPSETILGALKAVKSAGIDLASVESGLSKLKPPSADEETQNKAKAYDKLRDTAMTDAFKSGVRAKGEKFDEARWKKLMQDFSIEEIQAQAAEWDEESKDQFHAGKRFSSDGAFTGTPVGDISRYKF